MVTIEGRVLLAIEVALHPTALTSVDDDPVTPAMTPPRTPPTTMAAATTTHGSHLRLSVLEGLEGLAVFMTRLSQESDRGKSGLERKAAGAGLNRAEIP
jgi:hypothetical protein